MNFYGTGLRSSAAASTDALSFSDSYTALNISSIATTNRRSTTYFTGLQGDEIANYSYSYRADGLQVRSVG